jgi:long-chain acyl-CoA synthetase
MTLLILFQWLNPDDIVSFSGGVIKDKDGNPIWEVKCYSCGIIIEHGSEGSGITRVHCQDCNMVDICEECFEAKLPIHQFLKTMNSENSKILSEQIKKVDIHFFHLMSKENLHSVWLHGKVVDGKSFASRMKIALETYSKRICLGMRNKSDLFETTSLDGYEWLTYEQMFEICKKFSYSIHKIFPKRQFVGICLQNCFEWIISDISCSFNHHIVVGIHTTYDDTNLIHVLNNSEITTVICSSKTIKRFISISKKCPLLKNLILMDECGDLETELTLYNFKEWIDHQESFNFSKLDEIPKDSPSEHCPPDLTTIIYTSGSTGNPKGVMITYNGFFEDISHPIFLSPLITVSYIPLSHSTDRMRVWETLLNGGRVGFANYDPKNWSEHESGLKKLQLLNSIGSSNGVEELIFDTKVLRPTIFIAPPRIFNGLHSLYLKQLELEKEEDAIKFIRNSLGNRVVHLATGGEMISDFIVEFIKKCFPECAFDESYGCTESGGITMNGIAMSNVDFKLIDIPDLGFTTKDSPFPRGEIIVKTPVTSKGYYRLPEETNSSFIDGYFHTGDIGLIDDQNVLKIIGRTKNVSKLSDGRIYQPDALASIFESCESIDQICVCSGTKNDQNDFIIAVRISQI